MALNQQLDENAVDLRNIEAATPQPNSQNIPAASLGQAEQGSFGQRKLTGKQLIIAVVVTVIIAILAYFFSQRPPSLSSYGPGFYTAYPPLPADQSDTGKKIDTNP